MKNNGTLVLVQGQFKNQSSQPSRLSTRLKRGTMTLSSQYKVRSIQNNDPLVSVQGQFNSKQRSQYKVSSKINPRNPLISVQGQKEEQ